MSECIFWHELSRRKEITKERKRIAEEKRQLEEDKAKVITTNLFVVVFSDGLQDGCTESRAAETQSRANEEDQSLENLLDLVFVFRMSWLRSCFIGYRLYLIFLCITGLKYQAETKGVNLAEALSEANDRREGAWATLGVHSPRSTHMP